METLVCYLIDLQGCPVNLKVEVVTRRFGVYFRIME